MPDLTCAVLVLNWNGRAHLKHLLPTLREARAQYGRPLPMVVVDNRSTHDDVAWLHAEYPDVEVHVTPQNDYLFSLNAVVASRREDVVVILNNDMRVEPDFIAPLLSHFSHANVFAVSAQVREWDGRAPQIGARRMLISRHWLTHWFEFDSTRPLFTAEAGGGCSAFHRSRFVELGGFDPLYRPGYWEDFDLTYRAWRRGWTAVHEPRSVIYHRDGATLGGTLNDQRRDRLLARNRLLFLLKNVGGWTFAAGVAARLPYRVIYNAIWGDRAAARGMIAALPRIGSALRARYHLGASGRSASDIVEALSQPVVSL